MLVCASSLASAAGRHAEAKQAQPKALTPVARTYLSDSNKLSEVCGFPIKVEVDLDSFKDNDSLNGPIGYFHAYARDAFTTACTQDEKNASMKDKLKRILVVYDNSIPDDQPAKRNFGKLDLQNGTLTLRLNERTDRGVFEHSWKYIEATFK